jgi:hypothetical protein
MERTIVLVASTLLMSAGLGCGGGPGDACGRTPPCGGDLVGSWTITSGCVDPSVAVAGIENVLGGSCPGLTIDSVSTVQSGTFTFAADLTFTASASVGGTITATLPPSCLGGLTCAQVGTDFLIRGLSEGGCTGTSSCTCPIPRASSLTIDGGGTYSVADSMLTLVTPAGTGIFEQYCVTGSAMHIVSFGGGRVVDDIVLARVTR